MNLVLAALALGLVGKAVFAQRSRDPFCGPNEYPNRVAVEEYGGISFACAKSECGNLKAKCNQVFFELACKDKQWVGGVAGSSNVNNLVPLQCCDVQHMRYSRYRGNVTINQGEEWQGEQLRDNRGHLVAYDVISNLEKHRSQLTVHISRIQCKGKGASLASAQQSLFQGPPFGGGGFGRGGFGRGPGFGGGPRFGGPFEEEDDFLEEDGFIDDGLGDFGPPIEGDFGPPPFANQGPAPFAPVQAAPVPGPQVVPLGFAGGGGGFCFASDVTVETPSGHKTMEELKIGDHVLTIEDGIQKFAPVTSFLHRLPEANAVFKHIHISDGTSLKLTDKHFLYSANCEDAEEKPKLIFAKDVAVGDCLVKVDSELQTQQRLRVSEIRDVNQIGAYSPMTDNGVIITNNIMASCYSVVKNEEFMDSFVFYADKVKEKLGGLFSFLEENLPEGVIELPWLVKWGQEHLENLMTNPTSNQEI